MKSCKPRWIKIALDWAERELTAVMAVAIVLAFIFGYSLATDPETEKDIISATVGEGFWMPNTPTLAPNNGNSILFGSEITGESDDVTQWSGTVANLGDSILAPEAVSMSTAANDNSYNLAVTAANGTVKVNGVVYNFGNYGTQTKSVYVTGGRLKVDLTAGTQIYSIEAKTQDTSPSYSGSSAVMVPVTSIAVIPSNKTTVLSPSGTSTFTPVAVVRDSLGALVNPQLIWSSSDEDIATVDVSGKVTATKVGTVTITVTVKGTTLSASASLSVLAEVGIPTVNITPSTSGSEAPSTGGEEETAESTAAKVATESDEEILDRLFGTSTTPVGTETETTTEPGTETTGFWRYSTPLSTKMGTTGTDATLDLFASAQAAKMAIAKTTQLSQEELGAVINTTQKTITGKVIARVRVAVTEIAQTFKEIFVGNKVILPDGSTVKKPSVFAVIGNFIRSMTGGASATPTGAAVPGEDIN